MTDFTHSLAIVIGIDGYGGGIPPLTTAVNDATALAELLHARHGYETILLAGEVFGQPVTGERLAALFTQELPVRIGKDDRLLVYFAGHGVALDGDGGPTGYLIPQDARPDDRSTFLAMTDLHTWLTALPCRHMLAILDCCFAGAFRWASIRHIGVLPDVIHKERFDRYVQSPAWQVIASASYDQRAIDVLTGSVASSLGTRKEAARQHSPFAQALFDGLQGAGDLVPRGHGDGVITASELAVYVRQAVEIEAAQRADLEQTPQLWPLNKHRKGEFIFLVPGHPLNLPSAEALTDQNNPYLGLKSYESRHRELFFGRQEEIEAILAMLEQRSFVTVLGASGTGKSSLVKAGLLPRLEDAGGSWQVLPPIRPGDHPIQALAILLRGSLPDIPVSLDADDGLARVVAAWQTTNPQKRLVLTVDQCEELVTLCRDDAERAHFLALLAAAVQQHPDPFRLVMTLRTDFEPPLARETPLQPLWSDARYVIPPMDQADLHDVIEGPASVRVLYFEPPELVDTLVTEVIQMPGALPLLSFTLSEMYLRYLRSGRDDRSLRQQDYDALGGVIGSLRIRANEEYDRLPDDAHRLTMQRVMLRMVAVEGGELARRRVMLSELDYPTAEENSHVKTVLDRLVEARLLVRGNVDVGQGGVPDPYVEPAHDALVTAWDRLLRWKQETEEYLPLQRRTTQAALEWERAPANDKAGLLWNDDPRLPQLERILAPVDQAMGRNALARVRQALWPDATAPHSTAWLNRRELAFTQASVLQRARVLRRIVGITAAVIIVLAGLAVFAGLQATEATTQRNEANIQRDTAQTREAQAQTAATAEAQARDLAEQRRSEAERQAAIALGRQLAAQSINTLDRDLDTELSLLLAVQAVRAHRQAGQASETQVDEALRRALTAAPQKIIRFPAMGDEPVQQEIWPGVRFSPSAQRLLVTNLCEVSNCTDLVVIGLPAGEELVRVPNIEAGMAETGFSADDKILVTADSGGSVTVVSLNDGKILASYPTQAHAFRDGGSTLALATGDGTVQMLDLTAPNLPAARMEGVSMAAASDAPDAAALVLRPDGKQLAIIDADGQARLWSPAEGHERTLDAGGARLTALVFSGDGRYLAGRGSASTGDGYAVLWDTASGEKVIEHVYGERVACVQPGPTARWLAVGDSYEVHLWDVAQRAETVALPGSLFTCQEKDVPTFSPDETRILVNNAVGGMVYNTSNGERTFEFTLDTNYPAQWDFTPDWGRLALVETEDVWRPSTLYLMDTATSENVATHRHIGSVYVTAIRPGSEQVATISSSDPELIKPGAGYLWDAISGALLRTYRHTGTGGLSGLAFSADGSQMATIGADNTLRLWDMVRGGSVGAISELLSPEQYADLTAPPVGAELQGNQVNLYPPGGQAVTLPHDAQVESIAFSPDGELAVSRTVDYTTHVWDIARAAELASFQSADPGNPAFSADGSLVNTSGDGGPAQVWELRRGKLVGEYGSPAGMTVNSGISPNGERLFTLQGVGFVRRQERSASLFDVQESLELATVQGAISAAFSPDSSLFAAGCFDNSVRVLDANSGQELRVLRQEGEVQALAFSPDGRLLATGSTDGVVRVWNTRTFQEAATLSHGAAIETVRFSKDGKQLISQDTEGRSYRWTLEFGALADFACQLLTRNLTTEEWQTHVGTAIPFQRTCPNLP